METYCLGTTYNAADTNELNPVLKSIFTMLCWFGFQKILDAIKAWGRAMGYDADKSLRLGVPEKVPVLA